MEGSGVEDTVDEMVLPAAEQKESGRSFAVGLLNPELEPERAADSEAGILE